MLPCPGHVNAAINLRVQIFLQVNVFIVCRQTPKWEFLALINFFIAWKQLHKPKKTMLNRCGTLTTELTMIIELRGILHLLWKILSLGHISSLGCDTSPGYCLLLTVGVRVNLNRAFPPAKNCVLVPQWCNPCFSCYFVRHDPSCRLRDGQRCFSGSQKQGHGHLPEHIS